MNDYTKPIRWVDDKTPAKVLMLTGDGGAWVISSGTGTNAMLLDEEGKGKRSSVTFIENVPEEPKPIVSWVMVWRNGNSAASIREGYIREGFTNDAAGAKALLKITYTPGNGATVEVVEERK